MSKRWYVNRHPYPGSTRKPTREEVVRQREHAREQIYEERSRRMDELYTSQIHTKPFDAKWGSYIGVANRTGRFDRKQLQKARIILQARLDQINMGILEIEKAIRSEKKAKFMATYSPPKFRSKLLKRQAELATLIAIATSLLEKN